MSQAFAFVQITPMCPVCGRFVLFQQMPTGDALIPEPVRCVSSCGWTGQSPRGVLVPSSLQPAPAFGSFDARSGDHR